MKERKKNQLQMHFTGKEVWIIGIPEKNDLVRMGEKLAERGIKFKDVSWVV